MKLGTGELISENARGILAPGAVLDGRFAITEVFKEGGMATIFKARDLHNDGEIIALKVPHFSGRRAEVRVCSRGFQREEQIGCTLSHPSVLRFIEVKNKSRAYLAMEFLTGKTLYQVLRERRPLAEAEALSIATRICGALEYLHGNGVIHRDLKPENIMLCEDGSIRLMDFGIAWGPQTRRLTFVGFAPGTPHYMPPERVAGKRGDGRVDIYSLGAMLYEMLTGKIAFDDEDISVIMEMRVTGDPEPPRKINPRISRQAEEIVLHAMSRDPDKRYPTAASMKAELESPQSVEVTGRSDRLSPSTLAKRRWRKVRFVAYWVLVPVIAQILLFFALWHHLAGHKH